MTAVNLFYPSARTGVSTDDALAVSIELNLRLEAKLREVTADAMRLAEERDDALVELAKTSADFDSVWESRDTVIEERERARQACNAYWHDLTRIALLCAQTDDEYPLKAVERTVRERDLLKNHYSPEAAAKLRAELASARAEIEALKYPRAYFPPGEERSLALSAIMISQVETEIRALKAEVEVLRRERDDLYGAMLLAEERGAEWALEIALDPSRWPVSKWTPEEVCRDARWK